MAPGGEAGQDRAWLPTLWLLGAANLGLLVDGYDLFCIDLVVAILEKEYPGQMEARHKSVAVSASLSGTIVGMLVFGWLGHNLGRRRSGMITVSLQVLGAVLSALCSPAWGPSLSLQLAVCRFLLGLGIGGEFPLGVAMSVEGFSSPSFQGKLRFSPLQLLMWTTFMFKFGAFLASVVGLLLTSVGLPLDAVWRLSLALGAIPALAAFVLRLNMEETRAVESAERLAAEQAGESSRGATRPAETLLRSWKYEVLMVACMLVHSCYNFILYGQGSYKSMMAEQIFPPAHTTLATIRQDAAFGTFLSMAPLVVDLIMLPGVDQLGVRVIGLLAYFSCAGLNAAAALSFHAERQRSVAACTCVLFVLSAGTWGPMGLVGHATVPMNVPASLRTRYQGVAMAGAKAAGLLGAAVFPHLAAGVGLSAVSLLMAAVCLLACCLVQLFFPTWDADPRELDGLVKA